MQNKKIGELCVIGLTGGIATGKSFACDIFKSLGCAIISCDTIAKNVLENSEIIKTEFSDFFIDGKLERAILREQIFNNEVLRDSLNKVAQPLIFKELQRELSKIKKGVVVVEIPLLFDNKYASFENLLDKTVCTICDRELQLERLIKRDNITKSAAIKTIAAQMCLKRKASLCDYVLNTQLSGTELQKQIQKIIR